MLNVSALRLYRNLIGKNKTDSVKSEILRHTCLCLLLILPLILASLIEAYISCGLICMYQK